MFPRDLIDALGRAQRDLDDADRRWLDATDHSPEADSKAIQDMDAALAEVDRLESLLAELPAPAEPL